MFLFFICPVWCGLAAQLVAVGHLLFLLGTGPDGTCFLGVCT
jgi:hypothetical protein